MLCVWWLGVAVACSDSVPNTPLGAGTSLRDDVTALDSTSAGDRAPTLEGIEPANGRVLSVDSLSWRAGLEMGEPVAVTRGPDGTVDVLDHMNGQIYRLRPEGRVDTIGRLGAGPAEFSRPSAFAWLGDTVLVVVDEGNGRIQFLDSEGRYLRSVLFPRGGLKAVFDPERETMFAASFGRNFSTINGVPVIADSSLITAVDLTTGSVTGQFGSPRPYDGAIIGIFGNSVSLGFDRRTNSVWAAWPLDPHLTLYDSEGRPTKEILRSLEFDPPPPMQYMSNRSPMPAADFQIVTYDIDVDAAANLYVLTPLTAKQGRIGTPNYVPPKVGMEVFTNAGELLCRFALPVFASGFSITGSDELLLVDTFESAQVFRVKFRCT